MEPSHVALIRVILHPLGQTQRGFLAFITSSLTVSICVPAPALEDEPSRAHELGHLFTVTLGAPCPSAPCPHQSLKLMRALATSVLIDGHLPLLLDLDAHLRQLLTNQETNLRSHGTLVELSCTLECAVHCLGHLDQQPVLRSFGFTN